MLKKVEFLFPCIYWSVTQFIEVPLLDDHPIPNPSGGLFYFIGEAYIIYIVLGFWIKYLVTILKV